jgi:hypothetical protein
LSLIFNVLGETATFWLRHYQNYRASNHPGSSEETESENQEDKATTVDEGADVASTPAPSTPVDEEAVAAPTPAQASSTAATAPASATMTDIAPAPTQALAMDKDTATEETTVAASPGTAVPKESTPDTAVEEQAAAAPVPAPDVKPSFFDRTGNIGAFK